MRARGPRSTEQYARILIIVLGAAVLFALLPFLSGFVGAAVLATLVRPAHQRLSRHVGSRASAVLTTVGAVILVLVPGVLLVLSLATQAPDVVHAFTRSTLLEHMTTLQFAGVSVGNVADTALNALVAWLARQAGAFVSGVSLAALNIFVATLGLYYLLVSRVSLWDAVRDHLPFSSTMLDMLASRFRSTTESMIIGVVLTSVAQGTVVGGAFAVTGLPNALFWGFVTACVSILPVFGSSMVWFPGTLVLLMDRRYGAAVALGLIGVVIASQIDNLVRLLVYRRVSRTHPMITLVGAFAGIRIFGIAGLLLGPLAISYLVELLRAYSTEFGQRAVISESMSPARRIDHHSRLS